MKIKDIVKKALYEDDAQATLDNDPAVKSAQANVDKATQMLALAQQALANARANASKKLTPAVGATATAGNTAAAPMS